MDPIVSVIVPNYNHADFLIERIESVIHQTYSDFEVIILDDASTDTSKNIIASYQDHPKVTNTIYNCKNSGNLFLQWKKGVELAQGKYIWIAESDDICQLNFLETLVLLLENDPQLMLAYTDSEFDNLNWIKNLQSKGVKKVTYEGKKFILQNMLTSPAIINASAVLIRKKAIGESIFTQCGNYKTTFDWLFWCSIAMQGNVTFYPVKLNFFRQHLQSTSLKATQKGYFVTEGLQVISYLKKTYNINLNISQSKIWSSVWAQTTLITGYQRSMFFKNIKLAFITSPQILIYFFYYILKFKFFSTINIKIPKA